MSEITVLLNKINNNFDTFVLREEEIIKIVYYLLNTAHGDQWRKFLMLSLTSDTFEVFSSYLSSSNIIIRELFEELYNDTNSPSIYQPQFCERLCCAFKNLNLNQDNSYIAGLCLLTGQDLDSETFIYKLLSLLKIDESKFINHFRDQDYFQHFKHVPVQYNGFNPKNNSRTEIKPIDSRRVKNEMKKMIDKCEHRFDLQFIDWDTGKLNKYTEVAISSLHERQDEINEELFEFNNINKLIPNYIGINLVRA